MACLEPFTSEDHFDFVGDLGAELPMRTIGMLVGIPDAGQPTVRANARRTLRYKEGEPLPVTRGQILRRQPVRRVRGLAGEKSLR